MKLKVKPEFELIGTISDLNNGTFQEPWANTSCNLVSVGERLRKMGRADRSIPIMVILTQTPKTCV